MVYILPVGLSAEVNFPAYYTKPGFNLTENKDGAGHVLSREVAAPCGLSDTVGVRPPTGPDRCGRFSGREGRRKNHGF